MTPWTTPQAQDGKQATAPSSSRARDLTAVEAMNWADNGSNLALYEAGWPVAVGVEHRVAKLRAAGNAIVPACALTIFRAIAEYEYGSPQEAAHDD